MSPHAEPPSCLPPQPIPLGCPRTPTLSALLHTWNLHWSSILRNIRVHVSFKRQLLKGQPFPADTAVSLTSRLSESGPSEGAADSGTCVADVSALSPTSAPSARVADASPTPQGWVPGVRERLPVEQLPGARAGAPLPRENQDAPFLSPQLTGLHWSLPLNSHHQLSGSRALPWS